MNYFSEFLVWVRHINDTSVLHEVTLSIIKQDKMCIKANGGHFEYLLN